MAVTLSSLAGAGAQFFDNNGVPLAGGLIYTYLAGTSTPAATYTSSTGSIAHANPIVLDAAGRIAAGEVWLTSGVDYKFIVQTSLFVQLGSYDNIPSINDFTSIYAALASTTNVALGDALIGFKQSNSSGALGGAVGRTVHQKLQEFISVKDFGAVGDGIVNDAPAIQAAVNAVTANGGGTIYFPSGKYLVNTTVTIEKSGVWLEGAGSSDGGTWIVNGITNAPAIKFGDGVNMFFSNGISRMLFGQAAAVTPVAGNCGLMFDKVGTSSITDVYASTFPAQMYDGFVFSKTSQTKITEIRAQGCVNNGVVIKNDCLDLYIVDARADTNENNGWDIKFSNGLYFVNCTAYENDVRAWDIGTGSGATYFTNNLFFVNCVGDTSGADNWYFDQVNSFYLTNCWGSTQQNPAVNTGASGFILFGNLVTNGNFSNCAALYNNGDGFKIFGATNINIVGGQFGSSANGNGRAGAGSGIGILNNSEDITISSIQSTGNANHGINITAGNVRCNILGGTVFGNLGASIFGATNASSIRSVAGFNPHTVAQPAIPASGVAVVNTTGVDCNVYLPSGTGTVTQIQVNGTFLLTSPPASIFLPAGSSITLIYTVAPIWAWIGN